MDGNGRWAKKRAMPRSFGHRQGAKNIDTVIKACIGLKIKIVSLYAFSTENWKRDKEEIDGLFDMLREFFKEKKDFFKQNDIKVATMGNLSKFPDDLRDMIAAVKDESKNNGGIIVNVGLNYGGRAEITTAVNDILSAGIKSIDEQNFDKYLYTAGLPEPDLIIRTGGQIRLSNFMLFQAAYSELYFTPVLWPDFKERALLSALKNYQKRIRNFGAVK
jgi:undecaprenyl diphosphate synthase